jgi:hypothetical protein
MPRSLPARLRCGIGGEMSEPTKDADAGGETKKTSRKAWSENKTEMFLDHLAATGDIAGAASHADVSLRRVHTRLRKEPVFAEAWSAALRAACQTVEALMIGHVLASVDPDAAAPASGLEWDKAQRLLQMRGALTGGDRIGSARGGGAKGERASQVATRDETDAAILKGLASIAAKAKRRRGAV